MASRADVRAKHPLFKAFGAQFAVFAIVNLGNVFAYLFQVVLARYMTPADYGGFNALFAVAVVLAAPAAVLQLTYSKQTILLSAAGTGQLKELLSRGVTWTAAVAVAAILIGTPAAPAVSSFLSAPSSLHVALMMAFAGASVAFPMFVGIVQGLRRYIAFSFSLCSVPLARLLGGLFFVAWGGYGIGGALWACIASMLVGIALALFALRDILVANRVPLASGTAKTMRMDAAPMAASSLLMLAFVNLDIVLVRHYCSAEESGLYATASVLGRIAFLLPSVLANVLFPEAIHARSGKGQHRMLTLNLLATGLLAAAVALMLCTWPAAVLSFLMGEQYAAAAPLLRTVSIAMALLAMANSLFTYLLAHSDYRFIGGLLLSLLAFLVLASVQHDSAVMIAMLLLVCSGAVLAVGLVSVLRARTPASLVRNDENSS